MSNEVNNKLGLLEKAEFWRYINSLPEHSFKALMIVPEGDAGKAKTIISTQTGQSPPRCEVNPKE